MYTEINEKKYKKIPISKKCILHQKIGNQPKRTWHLMKAETLKKPCVKFEEGRLNTLQENRICKNVNQNVNQECAVHPPAAAHPDNTNLITGFFLQKTRLRSQLINMIKQAEVTKLLLVIYTAQITWGEKIHSHGEFKF